MEVPVYIEFDFKRPIMEFGPEPESFLVSLMASLRVNTGGFVNSAYSVPPWYQMADIRRYVIVLYLPPTTFALLELAPEKFRDVSGLDWWADRLGLSNVEILVGNPKTEREE